MIDYLQIPQFLTFSDLALCIDAATQQLLFAAAPLIRICRANGIDPAPILADEDLSCSMICGWYLVHRTNGGARDAVVETLLAQVAKDQASNIAVLQEGSTWMH